MAGTARSQQPKKQQSKTSSPRRGEVKEPPPPDVVKPVALLVYARRLSPQRGSRFLDLPWRGAVLITVSP